MKFPTYEEVGAAAEAADKLHAAAPEMFRALMVIAKTPETYAFLGRTDPMALKQVLCAIKAAGGKV